MFEAILPFDFAVTHFVQAFASPALTAVMQLASLALTAPVLMLFAAWLYWSRKEKDSFYFLTLITLSAMLSEAFKQLFQRLRPEFYGKKILSFETHAIHDYSFPSGHATLAGALFGYLEKGLEKNWKILLGIAVLIAAVSRIYLGSHFLTDVIAGLVLGFLIGKFNSWLRFKTEHMHFRITRLKEELFLFAVVIASIIIVIFLQELVIAAAVIGYFAGFSIFREMKLQQSGESLKRKIAGFAGLALIYLGTRTANIQQEFICYFLLGFWITFLYPLLYEAAKHKIKGSKGKH